MAEYVRSKPHVVILAPHNSQVAHDISKTLRSHSISAFLAPEDIKPGEAWMTRILDEINNAKIAVILSGISSQTDWAQLEMQLLLQRILSDPSFVVIPVINYPDDLSQMPKELRAFQAITLDSEKLTPSASEQLIDAVFSSSSQVVKEEMYSEQKSLSELVAQAQVILSRLEFIEDTKRYTPVVYEHTVLLSVSGVGIFLCIVALITKTVWFEYILVSGAVLIITGAILSLITAFRVKQRKKYEARVSMLRRHLEHVLERAKRHLHEARTSEGYKT